MLGALVGWAMPVKTWGSLRVATALAKIRVILKKKAKIRVIRVVRVPSHITRITQNFFGFSELLSELVIGYFGSRSGYFGFG